MRRKLKCELRSGTSVEVSVGDSEVVFNLFGQDRQGKLGHFVAMYFSEILNTDCYVGKMQIVNAECVALSRKKADI